MKVPEKFSLKAFQAVGMGTDEAETLSEQLASTIQSRLHEATLTIVAEIVGELNQMGHCLSEYGDATPGDVAFRDYGDEVAQSLCRLRLGVDTVISIGFGDTDAGQG